MVWTTRMNREQEALLSRIKERGFDGVELFLSLNEQANIPEMRRTLHPLGLHRTTSFVLPSDANLSARMPTFEPEVLPSLRDVWSTQGSWTPGTGYTDLERSCSALKDIGYDGWLTIESFAQPEPE